MYVYGITSSTINIDLFATSYMLVNFHLMFCNIPLYDGNILVINNRCGAAQLRGKTHLLSTHTCVACTFLAS